MACYICDAPEIGRFTPDLDIKGIGYCDKHKTDIQIALVAMDDDPKVLDKMVKRYKAKKKQHGNRNAV